MEGIQQQQLVPPPSKKLKTSATGGTSGADHVQEEPMVPAMCSSNTHAVAVAVIPAGARASTSGAKDGTTTTSNTNSPYDSPFLSQLPAPVKVQMLGSCSMATQAALCKASRSMRDLVVGHTHRGSLCMDVCVTNVRQGERLRHLLRISPGMAVRISGNSAVDADDSSKSNVSTIVSQMRQLLCGAGTASPVPPAHCNNLVSLHLHRVSVQHIVPVPVAHLLPCLEQLALTNCDVLGAILHHQPEVTSTAATATTTETAADNTPFTAATHLVPHYSRCTKLQHLSVLDTRCGSTQYRCLHMLPALSSLRLDTSNNIALIAMCGMHGLTRITASLEQPDSPKLLARYAPHVRHLTISAQHPLSSKNLTPLRHLQHLQHLRLPHQSVHYTRLARLAALPQLQQLEVLRLHGLCFSAPKEALAAACATHLTKLRVGHCSCLELQQLVRLPDPVLRVVHISHLDVVCGKFLQPTVQAVLKRQVEQTQQPAQQPQSGQAQSGQSAQTAVAVPVGLTIDSITWELPDSTDMELEGDDDDEAAGGPYFGLGEGVHMGHNLFSALAARLVPVAPRLDIGWDDEVQLLVEQYLKAWGSQGQGQSRRIRLMVDCALVQCWSCIREGVEVGLGWASNMGCQQQQQQQQELELELYGLQTQHNRQIAAQGVLDMCRYKDKDTDRANSGIVTLTVRVPNVLTKGQLQQEINQLLTNIDTDTNSADSAGQVDINWVIVD